MSDSEELGRLADLHQRGALSDEEFARAKARALDGGRGFAEGAALNRLRRSRDDRWLSGVCGGLARFTGLASWAVRLLFAGALLCAGTGALIYLLLWIFVPQD